MTIEQVDIEESTIMNDETIGKLLTNENDVNEKENISSEKPIKLTICRVLLLIKTDQSYRQKIIYTVVLCWSFFSLGWAEGMVGPTFPDLRQIIKEDVSKSSWLLTVGSFGYLCGSILGGLLYNKLNKVLLLAVCSFGSGITTLLTPYCSTFSWMIVIKLLSWVFFGGLETCGNADIIHVWGREVDPYIQALFFVLSVGSFLSPMATEPFLTGKTVMCENNLTFSSELVPSPSDTELPRHVLLNNDFNDAINMTHSVNRSTHTSTCSEQEEETEVFYAFLIAAILLLTSAVGYIYLYIKIKVNKEAFIRDNDNDSRCRRNEEKHNLLSNYVKVFFIILLASLLAVYAIVLDNFTAFFMTFSLDYLKWDKSKGLFATAMFWFSFAVGRFAGIFLVSCCTNSTLLMSFLLMLALSQVGFLVVCLFKYYPLIWIFIFIMGFAMSVIHPAFFSWTSEHVIYISGKISALFLTSVVLVGLFFPLLIGHLMEHYNPMWFVYVLVAMATTCLILYVFITMLYKCYINKTKTRGGSTKVKTRKEN